MKRKIKCAIVIFLTMLAFIISMSFSVAEALPTLAEALRSMNQTDESKIEILYTDELRSYQLDNNGDIYDNANGFKILIMQREDAEKEFTELDSGYPNQFITDFPDDFNGVDVGLPRAWLLCDMMKRLPKEFRATSLEDATFILIVDDIYYHSGTISHQVVSANNDSTQIPDYCTTPEEIENYISSHQPTILSIKYYPVFSMFSVASLFNRETTLNTYIDYNSSLVQDLSNNPEACDLWNQMVDLLDLSTALTSEPNGEISDKALETLDNISILSETTADIIKKCIESKEYDSAALLINNNFWKLAEQLSVLDGNANHQRIYDVVIENHSIDALKNIVSYFNYSGLKYDLTTIRNLKLYLAHADQKWEEETIGGFIDELINMLN